MNKYKFRVDFVGDCGIQIYFCEKQNIDFKKIIEKLKIHKIKDICFSYETLTIFFDPITTDAINFKDKIYSFLQKYLKCFTTISSHSNFAVSSSSIIEIPVCFCRNCALDYDKVEKYTKISFKEFTNKYVSHTYKVLFIGFQPGFPFLGGLPRELYLPRLETPRLNVPSGSVGIGGSQTGIYTFSTPGGWNIIGKTAMKLFDLKKGAFLKVGDTIKFQIVDYKFH